MAVNLRGGSHALLRSAILHGYKVVESESLLNTKEAATFLRVSEASIRRWSDGGLIPVRRVGRRQERRFARTDLVGFLGQPTGLATPRAAAPPTVNVGGIAVPLRSHLSPIFGTDAGGLRLSVPFLADGLRAGHRCFLAATGPVLERYARSLADDQSIDFAGTTREGRLTIAGWPGASVAEAIAGWELVFGKALAKGPTVLRVVGEMTCERSMFASDAEMLAYEQAYELMANRYPLVTLCQYDAREFDGEIMLHVLKSHPDMFERNMGAYLN
jgi:MEDS: MEthanogen/methylotroph, DcmR Sensory domain/Helix-turn-helix domain